MAITRDQRPFDEFIHKIHDKQDISPLTYAILSTLNQYNRTSEYEKCRLKPSAKNPLYWGQDLEFDIFYALFHAIKVSHWQYEAEERDRTERYAEVAILGHDVGVIVSLFKDNLKKSELSPEKITQKCEEIEQKRFAAEFLADHVLRKKELQDAARKERFGERGQIAIKSAITYLGNQRKKAEMKAPAATPVVGEAATRSVSAAGAATAPVTAATVTQIETKPVPVVTSGVGVPPIDPAPPGGTWASLFSPPLQANKKPPNKQPNRRGRRRGRR